MDWRVDDLPELSHLPKNARAAVIEACFGLGRDPLAVRARDFGVVVGVILFFALLLCAGAVIAFARPYVLIPLLLAFIACLVGANLFLRPVMVRRARRELRVRLAEEFPEGRFPFCFLCRYDLRSSNGDSCPECGGPTVLADERGLPRPSGPHPLPTPRLVRYEAERRANRRVVPWFVGLQLALLVGGVVLENRNRQGPRFATLMVFVLMPVAMRWLVRRLAGRDRAATRGGPRSSWFTRRSNEL